MPLGISLLVAELQRVGQRLGHLDLGEDAAVEQRGEAVARRDRHVVAAMGADVQVVRQFAVEQHRAALVALGPEVLGHLAAREHRVDPRADVVGDPVHAWPCPAAVLTGEISRPGRGMQSPRPRSAGPLRGPQDARLGREMRRRPSALAQRGCLQYSPVTSIRGEAAMTKFDKSRLPSRHVTEGPARAPHRSYYYAMGMTEAEIHQPLVGVATCWNEAAPCNIALNRQAQAVKMGVKEAHGTPARIHHHHRDRRHRHGPRGHALLARLARGDRRHGRADDARPLLRRASWASRAATSRCRA